MSYYHYKSFWNVVKHKTLNFEMSDQKVLCQVKINVDQTLCLDTYTMLAGALDESSQGKRWQLFGRKCRKDWKLDVINTFRAGSPCYATNLPFDCIISMP